MTYDELKNKINNVIETVKGQTNISGYKLNVILNDLLNFSNGNSSNYTEWRASLTQTGINNPVVNNQCGNQDDVTVVRASEGITAITKPGGVANASVVSMPLANNADTIRVIISQDNNFIYIETRLFSFGTWNLLDGLLNNFGLIITFKN